MYKQTIVGIAALISALPFVALAQRDIACSITATPSHASPGERVTLQWNSQNARSAMLEGHGPIPTSGSTVVSASQTRDYVVTVSGYENNYVGCVARLTVVAKQPSCNISLVPFAVASNNFATLSWSTDFADSVYISGIGNVQPKGNQMVRAVGNTTYYLSARGAGGLCERSADLNVREQYQAFGYFTPTVQSLAYPLFGYPYNSNQNNSYNNDPYYYYDNHFYSDDFDDEWEIHDARDPYTYYVDDDDSSYYAGNGYDVYGEPALLYNQSTDTYLENPNYFYAGWGEFE